MSSPSSSNEGSTQKWVSRSQTYGQDHETLNGFIESIARKPMEVEIAEVRPTGESTSDSSVRALLSYADAEKVVRKQFSDIPSLLDYFCCEVGIETRTAFE